MKGIGLGVAAAIGTLFLISALASLFPPFDVTSPARAISSALLNKMACSCCRTWRALWREPSSDTPVPSPLAG